MSANCRNRAWRWWAALAITGAAHAGGVMFDDFSYADSDAARRAGWILRDAPGHPGVPGAQWRAEAIEWVDDPARPGNRLLRLTAATDGTPAGTQQAQLCHARKYLRGTYAARVRFSDAPVAGTDGDPVIQTFYAVAPLRRDYDPEFSEIDWEYLPNGGWGSDRTRLYGISWQTVRIEPWDAVNQAHQEFGSAEGWHVLVMQVDTAGTRHYLDGRLLAQHGGRYAPAVPMAIAFSLWFSPSGLLPPGGIPRTYQQDVDWVFHAAGRQLSPAQVAGEVRRFRARRVTHVDTVAAQAPPLASPCDF